MDKEINPNVLLDYWTPPDLSSITDTNEVINPISFISTTYTFDSEFFEDECLTRFLSMETEREEDGVAFLVEKEEKLAGLHGGIIIVDQNNCKGSRSLRWDLVPCRVNNGVMHAKITVLHWSNCIRLIFSSANLTQSGYCINQEVFGVIDYTPDGEADLKVITDVLNYLEQMISIRSGDVVKKRYKKLQAEIKNALGRWNIIGKQYKNDEIVLQAVFVSPNEKNALSQLKNLWDSRSTSPPDEVFITSPFFDPEETAQTPSVKIFDIVRQRGEVNVNYNVTTEPISETSTDLLVHAPEFIKKVPNGNSHHVHFHQLDENGINEDKKKVPRPIHLKSIWLCNEDWNIYMVGSSNFTSAGLGLGKRNNYEANLAYVVSESRNRKGYNSLSDGYLEPIKELEINKLKFKYCINEDETTEESEYINLPSCFGEAVLKKIEEAYYLELNLNPEVPPVDFNIHSINGQAKINSENCIYNFEAWVQGGKKKKISLEWNGRDIPEHLLVNWKDSKGNAFWPLIVEDQITLPPVDALRNLPLEALLQILATSQPLHRLLKLLEKFKTPKGGSDLLNKAVDPLLLVDSSGFLLQRTRRISYAMRALKERLERPVFTTESLNWRLYGPIGVQALKEAVEKEARSEEEKMFLLAELALELSRIQPQTTTNSIKSSTIKSTLKLLLKGLSEDLLKTERMHTSPITVYSNQALSKAINEL